MAIPRRRFTFSTGTSTHRSPRIEKTSSARSPRPQEIPEWCRNYQLRIEAAREQLKQIEEAGEPEEAELGLGEIEMRQADPVQQHLQGLTQQIVHIIEACNSEKEIMEEEFLSVHQEIQILEGRIRTERSLIDGEVSGVGGQLMVPQAILEELRNGINILQGQDNDIVKEASEVFGGISAEVQDLTKNTTTNHNSLLNHKSAIVKLQDDFKIWKNTQQSIKNRVEAIDKHVRRLPTREELDMHTKALNDTLANIQEVSSGLTTHMEQ
jgi:chromosome segregation ATPase